MAMGVIGAIILIFIAASFAYGVLMIFFPEWVGITGKTALEYEKSHTEGSEVDPDDDFVERIQKTSRH